MKNKIPLIALIGVALLLSSCGATKYMAANQSFWTGNQGYTQVPLDNATWQVTFQGNEQTSDQVVNQYALYRAAEITTQQGFDYFVVMSDNDFAAIHTSTNGSKQTQIERTVDPLTGKTVPVAVTTTNNTTTTSTVSSHKMTLNVRLFKGDRPADNPQAYDAKSMVALMGPTIQR